MGTIDRYKYLFVVNDRMKRVIAVHTLFDSQPDGPVHRRMRRGGGGGQGGPPAFGQLSFLGSGGPFFGQQQWWEGGVFQFSGGRMTSRRQCPRGGGVLVKSPPSGNPVSAPVICVKFWAINPSAPLTKALPIRLWSSACMYVCICMYVYIVTCLTSWY